MGGCCVGEIPDYFKLIGFAIIVSSIIGMPLISVLDQKKDPSLKSTDSDCENQIPIGKKEEINSFAEAA